MSILYLSQSDTQEVLSWADVIAGVRDAYRKYDNPVSAPPRVLARNGAIWLRVLTAIPVGGRYMGTKAIAKARAKGSTHTISLWSQDTAELVCLIEGRHVTAMRTAATSAVAVDNLAPKKSLRVAVLGSGAEASAHVSAIATIRQLEAILVYSPTASNREAFARKYTLDLGVDCCTVSSAREAVRGADLIIAAARSRDETPILEGAWLESGMTIISIGSTLPEQREVDPEVVGRADLIVADVPEEVIEETGDMIAAREAKVEFEHKIVSLAQLLREQSRERDAKDIMLFKSIGSGLQDIAVAALCYEKALERGVGTILPVPMGSTSGVAR